MNRPEPAATDTTRYSQYVLFVLVLVYVFNFVDRQILSILAEDIKADLGLSDARLGFLYGTAFAVFYAIFGIPLARLADVWVRRKLISIGLFFWSLLTALSGIANGFPMLAALRIGVGIGEASASPAAYSMLSDYFPPHRRATVMAIYSSGVYLGSGLGSFLGGWIVEGWNQQFPPGSSPFGLAGWQVAFVAVGTPGILMSFWVATLREPVRRGRGASVEPTTPSPVPWQLFASELMAVMPPLTIISLYRAGVSRAGLLFNLAVAAVCAALAWLAIQLIGTPVQWIALAIGGYAFASWVHGLSRRDPQTYELIFCSRAMVTGMIGFGWIAFAAYGLSFWMPPFLMRVHHVDPGLTGTVLGLVTAFGGWLGVYSGGLLSDRMKVGNPMARPLVGIITILLSLLAGISFVLSSNIYVACACALLWQIASSAWVGPAIALSSELVEPRMRATASAFYILTVTFLGLALGPYTIGYVSDHLAASGGPPDVALRWGLMSAFLAFLPALVMLVICCCFVEREEHRRWDH